MQSESQLTIRIAAEDSVLSPDNYDIKDLKVLLEHVDRLLAVEGPRPLISYEVKTGSVQHVFKTQKDCIETVSLLLMRIQARQSIDFLRPEKITAIEYFQKTAVENNHTYNFYIDSKPKPELVISPVTNFMRTAGLWFDAELYFYGTLQNIGGKGKSNIHLDTEEFGYLTIQADKEILSGQKNNLLYQKVMVRASGKQEYKTHQIDKKSLKLIEFVAHNPQYNAEALEKQIAKTSQHWTGIDPEKWLHNIRYG